MSLIIFKYDIEYFTECSVTHFKLSVHWTVFHWKEYCTEYSIAVLNWLIEYATKLCKK